MDERFVAVGSLDDPRLSAFKLNERGLASRTAKRNDAGEGRFLAEGDLVAERALAAGCIPDLALVDDQRPPKVAARIVDAGGTVFVGGAEVRREVTGLGMPHPIIALFHRPPRPSATELVERSTRLVVVEGVDNPVNVGSIVRNAAGLGWDGLLLDHTSADPLARRSLRVAMGTAFELPHARTTSLSEVLTAASQRMALYALTPDHGAADLRQIASELPSATPRAILIGSERDGLSTALVDLATPVKINMSGGVDSLNAAAATAVACYALA